MCDELGNWMEEEVCSSPGCPAQAKPIEQPNKGICRRFCLDKVPCGTHHDHDSMATSDPTRRVVGPCMF
uniref:Uncharacterized protein n=1 Tax=Setaria viridis TaxID=4556 RepID=A0A4U6U3Y7_SETVI|nr:hypothetical protein SEVIR_6G003950v2 [Setaria viridis]